MAHFFLGLLWGWLILAIAQTCTSPKEPSTELVCPSPAIIPNPGECYQDSCEGAYPPGRPFYDVNKPPKQCPDTVEKK